MKTILAPRLRRDRPWLATWLQGRRRRRLALSAPSGSLVDLETGLHLWFDAVDGACRVGSYGEADLPEDGELLGGSFGGIAEVAAAGGYAQGESLRYHVCPYKLVGGVKIYLGVQYATHVQVADEGGESAVEFPGWADTAPAGVDGYTVTLWLNTTTHFHRHVTLAAMMAGWLDTGAGWTAGLPWSYASPIVARKLAWCRAGQESDGEASPVVVSPFAGEVAFDSSTGRQFVHGMADDEMRMDAWTLAFWVRPSTTSGGALAALRGVTAAPLNMGLSLDSENGLCAFGDGGELAYEGHVAGEDWYLVVVRYDGATETLTYNGWRLRDGAAQVNVDDGAGSQKLTAESDYYLEALNGAVSFGSSWMWSSDSYAAFCRMGFWSRVLGEDEVEDLWNLGLGWRPGD